MEKNIQESIFEFPQQIKRGLHQKGLKLNFKENFNKVLVCGMGGSALAADFLKKFYPISLHRNYGLPQYPIDDKTLIVCISYSGNTEETLSAYKTARDKSFPLVAISSGGILTKKALEDKVPLIKIKSKNIEPRMSVVEQIFILIYLFKSLSINPFRKFQEKISPPQPRKFTKQAQEIAKTIKGKIPLIYASAANQAMAYYWKAIFNENDKIPAFWNVFPEINHNELMQGKGMPNLAKKIQIINLWDESDNPKIKKRMRLTSHFLQQKGINVTTIKIEGATPLEKIVNVIILGNWITLFLSQELKIDPLDPDIREKFKAMMKK